MNISLPEALKRFVKERTKGANYSNPSDYVRSLIREGKTVQIPNVIQTQKKLGMETLNDALLNLVKSRSVEPEEAYVRAVEKKDMLFKLRGAGFALAMAGGEE